MRKFDFMHKSLVVKRTDEFDPAIYKTKNTKKRRRKKNCEKPRQFGSDHLPILPQETSFELITN